jgi:hypothetical protein
LQQKSDTIAGIADMPPAADKIEVELLIKCCVGHMDPADEIRRHICAVELSQVALDLAHRHAARVEAQDFLIEPIEAGLTFGDQLRLEAAGPVSRHRKGYRYRESY